MSMNLWQAFAAVAEAVPERRSVVGVDRTLNFAELRDRATRFGNAMSAHGLGCHRDRAGLLSWESGQDLLATYLYNSPEYLEVSLGSFASRVASFNVNYRYVRDELVYLLNDAQATAIVYHAAFADQVKSVLPRLERKLLLIQVADSSGNDLLEDALDYEEQLATHSGPLSATGHSGDDLYVLYTGGTTGMPKGTLWRQDDAWKAALCEDLFPGATAESLGKAVIDTKVRRVLPNAPLMHGAAQWLALRTLYQGSTVILNGVVDRLDPADVWRRVEREHVTAMLMVGESFARPLLDELERVSYDVSSVKLLFLGGAPTTPGTKSRLLAALPGAWLFDSAGSTEMGNALAAPVQAGDDVSARATFQPSDETVVLDELLSRVLIPGAEETGWLAKSGAIPLGYLGDEAKTLKTFPVVQGMRYVVPGDRARWRADGRIELLGRDAVTINSGGEKIFVEEVEAALLTHQAVRDVVVVGRESEQWGQEVVAVVSLREGQDPSDDELRVAAAQHVARYKLPKRFVRVNSVLRNPSGKADYGWAKALVTDTNATCR